MARAFVYEQLVLSMDMQYRSQIYHVQNGVLNAGPIWDLEQSRVPAGSRTRETWAIREGSQYLDWYNKWTKSHDFVREIAVNGSKYIDQYMVALQASASEIAAMDMSNEIKRFPNTLSSPACMRLPGKRDGVKSVHNYITSMVSMFQARANWLKANMPTHVDSVLSTSKWHKNSVVYPEVIGLIATGLVLALILPIVVKVIQSVDERNVFRLPMNKPPNALHLRALALSKKIQYCQVAR